MATATKNRVGQNGEATKPEEKKEEVVRVLKLDLRTIDVKIRGTASLIMNRRSPELVQKLEDKQSGKAQLPKAPKDPKKCFRESCHMMPGSKWEDKKPLFGFPAIAFKAAMVDAANDMGVKQTHAKRAFRVLADDGDLVRIDYDQLRMDTRVAPLPNGSADVRHRGEFIGWSCTLRIVYNASVMSVEEVVNVLSVAGFGVGIGEMRIKGKKSSGEHGSWEVVTKK